MSVLRRLVESRYSVTNFDTDRIDWSLGGASTHSGVSVTPLRALQQITVWACVRLIAGSIAALPTGAFVRDGEVRKSYPRPHWMWKPNPEMISVVFWEQFLISLLLYGNSYLAINRARDYEVLDLWPLHPDNVSPVREGASRRLRYRVRTESGETTLTPNIEILHVPGFTIPGSVEGLNPIAYARQAIGLGLSTEEMGSP